ncbi:hypothetical protein R1O37_01845, partial [Klebsiella sp. 90403]|nr:hypothetical protein [Klebsiella pneumoniae]MCJ5673655.1 hypothetical protein [Klebsiella pneumoniae]MCJ5793444.1 hypothetical protein [Klebsiella pneumoniae]
SAQIREILISESAWEEMTCLFAPSLANKYRYQYAQKSPERILQKGLFISPPTAKHISEPKIIYNENISP